ncbi:DUF4340 domain-containing protein [Oleiharenicola lentus]|uniref:DUF4340 domain-containing protein n=1 Tax=Oleiharenicola lentus TaxID=2508720 RepID=A0A4Q1CA95_9BACT|nr:DUF4340 domain-containing protein [Oleiharenicola lentus]RXK55772.1 DUF4340 domain-containing protein [Oleiharenicola lentus]
MRSKVTVVLLFLNVVVFGYIYYFMAVRDPTLESRRRVLPPEIASLKAFTRTTRSGETVRLEKRDNTSWWLTAPFEWPANPNAVNRIHNELQFLEHETSFTVAELEKGGQSLADYGLNNPMLTLDLGTVGKEFRLLVGDDTRTGNRLYLYAPATQRVHVVSRSLAESVGLPLSDLRTDTIFTIPVFEVRSLNIQTGAPAEGQTTTPANLKVRLRRDQSGRWGFETPIIARADKAGVETTINALNSLTALSFPDQVEADRTGLDAPILRVTFEGTARRETLLLGSAAADGAYYARFEDKNVIFTAQVPEPLLKVLRSSQEELRDRHVLDLDPGSVTALTITAPGLPELSLQRLEATGNGQAQWQAVTRSDGQAPVTTAADADVIGDLLEKLKRLSASKFLSDAPSDADKENWGFNRPEREISLSLSTGGGLTGNDPTTALLQIGVSPDRPGLAFARLNNPPFVYEIVPDILNDTPVTALHYRQRLLRKLPEGAVLTSLSLVDLGTGTSIYSQKLAAGDKSWDAALAVESESARKALRAVIDELATLRAARFTAESFSSDHAITPEGSHPWRYRLDYTVSFANAPDTPASLFVTERLGGSTLLAGTAEFGGVTFAVNQPLLDALFTLTYREKNDPGPAPAPPADPAPAPAENKPAGTQP